jgi:hypothetical protein
MGAGGYVISFKKNKRLSDSTIITVETDATELSELLEDFKNFLMACGYHINPTDELIIWSEEQE